MRDPGAEFFEEFGQIPSKEFGLVLKRLRGWRRCSLRRKYLGKEQMA
jgi:hypothetical protein